MLYPAWGTMSDLLKPTFVTKKIRVSSLWGADLVYSVAGRPTIRYVKYEEV